MNVKNHLRFFKVVIKECAKQPMSMTVQDIPILEENQLIQPNLDQKKKGNMFD